MDVTLSGDSLSLYGGGLGLYADEAYLFVFQMTAGRFVNESQLETVQSGESKSSAQKTQIVLGSETGAIYLVSNFEVTVDSNSLRTALSSHAREFYNDFRPLHWIPFTALLTSPLAGWHCYNHFVWGARVGRPDGIHVRIAFVVVVA